MDTFARINRKEELIIEALGFEGAFDAVVKALSYDTKEDVYDYILRCYEIEDDTEEEEA